ncbi:DUF4410 domain-containing protein [Geobacter sp. FeAm09]|uniref:DUF4410 domain-containing protein n=1 Tax=Geobacter sp. FeAm09 TaxID=2597769 RepID=UPI0011EE611A|nr:DUF4410 domain-containing protein [Geobacter sp. FeAm09]QEM67802.1 DUF4410 domain-containing protein [Geobacter sp. FeAm09]
MKKIALVLQVFCLVTVASLAHADQPLAKPGVLNEEAVMTSQRLSGYDTIVIRDFSTAGTVYDRIDDEEKPKVDAMKPLIVKSLTLSIEAEMAKRKLFKRVLVNSEPQGSAVILEGAFTEFNGGSRALRFWVGFGAGKTYLKVKGRLLDAASGKELATFEDQETGYRGVASMESFEDLFPHQAQSLGQNIGEFLEKLY